MPKRHREHYEIAKRFGVSFLCENRRRAGTLVFLLYQKGRDSRIFQAQDRAIDNFTLKGICAGII
jgi:hypothetical protein